MAAENTDDSGTVFTGERVVPGKVHPALWAEHRSRYLAASLWAPGRKVLDFGCGIAYGADLLISAGARQVVGCDLAPEALFASRRQYPTAARGLVAADCLAAPFPADTFELVVSFEAIEHVPSHRDYLAEARRVLRPGGLLIVSTPNRKTYTDETGNRNPFHTREFYLDEFRDALAEQFPAIALYGQFTCEGLLFSSDATRESGDSIRRLSARGGTAAADLDRADFFVALCSDDPAAIEALELSDLFHPTGTTELARMRRELIALQSDFDERSRWALDLNQQLEERGQRLLQLQREFDERTEWALLLDRQREELEKRVAQLEAVCEKLAQRERELESRLGERGPNPARS